MDRKLEDHGERNDTGSAVDIRTGSSKGRALPSGLCAIFPGASKRIAKFDQELLGSLSEVQATQQPANTRLGSQLIRR